MAGMATAGLAGLAVDLQGAIHSTKIQTGPTGKRGPPQKVDPFFRNFSGWTEPIHCVLDRNFRKFWLNGSRPRTRGGVLGLLYKLENVEVYIHMSVVYYSTGE